MASPCDTGYKSVLPQYFSRRVLPEPADRILFLEKYNIGLLDSKNITNDRRMAKSISPKPDSLKLNRGWEYKIVKQERIYRSTGLYLTKDVRPGLKK